MSWIMAAVLGSLLLLIPTAYAAKIGAPYAPTRLPVVRKAFKLIGLDETDLLVDLGAGDGSILIEASKHKARAVGYELSPIMWLVIKLRTLSRQQIKLRYANFYKQKLPADTTVIFAFLMPNNMPRVLKFLRQQNLPRAKYFLAYAFPLPSEVEPLNVAHAKNCSRLYVYSLRSIVAS